MNAAGDDASLVLQQVRDGSGREHDVYLVMRDGELVLHCPSAYWSITLTLKQGDTLADAIKDKTKLARGRASS